MSRRTKSSVPVTVAAKAYGKDPSWVRAGIIAGWLPIGKATRSGKEVTTIEEIDSKRGRINYYISPQLLYEQTGFKWEGERKEMRAELSENSEWHLNRHRFLELKHWCLQYHEWEKMLKVMGYRESGVPLDEMIFARTDRPSDPTAQIAIARNAYEWRMELVKKTAQDVCQDDLSKFIFEGVTDGLSFEELEKKYGRVPCSRDTYYDRYRKFFALLHIRRG